jgi:hypothetical protein
MDLHRSNMGCSYLIWQRLLETLGRGVLDALGDSRLALGVGLSLAVLVGGHSGGLGDEACLLEDGACDSAEFESKWHDEEFRWWYDCEVIYVFWADGVVGVYVCIDDPTSSACLITRDDCAS